MTMTLKNYLDLLATKIDEAGEQGDRVEAIRLLKLGQDLFSDEIRKLEHQLHQQQEGKAAHSCCERDYDHDGNCDIHSAPGIMRLGHPEVGRSSTRESNLKPQTREGKATDAT